MFVHPVVKSAPPLPHRPLDHQGAVGARRRDRHLVALNHDLKPRPLLLILALLGLPVEGRFDDGVPERV